ncbi:hypothetical protein RRG08_058778 [Elysia crispata]|uniref:Uncharacterized protein n=1 Tax=Elysia crispata TaxID=231223 RepID=A0AAE0YWQ1_9GAST|nr:hypothetical protein RRG08_058778 [Elysia crispata]
MSNEITLVFRPQSPPPILQASRYPAVNKLYAVTSSLPTTALDLRDGQKDAQIKQKKHSRVLDVFPGADYLLCTPPRSCLNIFGNRSELEADIVREKLTDCWLEQKQTGRHLKDSG